MFCLKFQCNKEPVYFLIIEIIEERGDYQQKNMYLLRDLFHEKYSLNVRRCALKHM